MKHFLATCAALSVAVAPISAASAQSQPLDQEWLDSAISQSSRQQTYRLPSPDVHEASIRRMYPRAGETCRTSVQTAYDIRGFWLPVTVQACANSITDISSGAYAPAPGQMLFFVNGRAHRGSLYSLTRARPNTAYEFTRDDEDESGYFGYSAARPTAWSQAASALPFVPFAVATYRHDGVTRYAYADLRIPPGLERQAFPLNSHSIVVSVDGFIFNTPDALAATLTYGVGDTPYVEVFYVQRNESPQRMRRAFIPRLSLTTAGTGWRSLASSTNVGRRDHLGNILAFMGVLATFAALWHIDQATGFSEMIRRQHDECVARGIPGVVC